jgi:hypothetical protein
MKKKIKELVCNVRETCFSGFDKYCLSIFLFIEHRNFILWFIGYHAVSRQIYFKIFFCLLDTVS